MSIRDHLREIGRGKNGARNLTRTQASDLMGQVLDGGVSDTELGGFCIAMRVKGETTEEMLGFLDAARARAARVPASVSPTIVLPSYNGARRLPLFTPLLALLLARSGAPVLLHHHRTEDRRVDIAQVFAALEAEASRTIADLAGGTLTLCPLAQSFPALARLLDVRRVLGLRNSGHSLVKMLDLCEGPSLVVGSYTHPEYEKLMRDVFAVGQYRAMLLRGTEGEPVADARRMPAMEAFCGGRHWTLQAAQEGSVASGGGAGADGGLASGQDPRDTARRILAMLDGSLPVPPPIARQVEHILHLSRINENSMPASP